MDKLEGLYLLVTDAILRAEALEYLQAPGAAAAHLDVSLLEEEIARVVGAASFEGALARRGAVRAAVAARSFGRARELVERYAADMHVSDELRQDLRSLVDQDSSEAGPDIFGRPTENWEGMVVDAQEMSFVALLVDLAGEFADYEVHLGMDEVGYFHKDQIVPGSVFRLTKHPMEREGSQAIVSTIEFRVSPVPSELDRLTGSGLAEQAENVVGSPRSR